MFDVFAFDATVLSFIMIGKSAVDHDEIEVGA